MMSNVTKWSVFQNPVINNVATFINVNVCMDATIIKIMVKELL